MAGSLGADPRECVSTLGLGEAAPDAVWLPDRQGVLATFALYRAYLAHRLRPHLAALSLILAFLRARGEEEVGVVSAAECRRLPGTIR